MVWGVIVKEERGAQCWSQLEHTVSAHPYSVCLKRTISDRTQSAFRHRQPRESYSPLSGTPISAHAHKASWMLELGSPMLTQERVQDGQGSQTHKALCELLPRDSLSS